MIRAEKGDFVRFDYNGKPRAGTVDDVKQSAAGVGLLVLHLETPEDGTEYKSFKLDGIRNYRASKL